MFLLVSAVLIIGSVYFWAPVCDKFLELNTGKFVHMKCHYSAVASVLLAVIMLAVLLESVLMKKQSILVPIITGIALMVLIGDSPLSLGLCKAATMACQKTKLWINLSGVFAILSGLSAWFISRKGRERPLQLD